MNKLCLVTVIFYSWSKLVLKLVHLEVIYVHITVLFVIIGTSFTSYYKYSTTINANTKMAKSIVIDTVAPKIRHDTVSSCFLNHTDGKMLRHHCETFATMKVTKF